MTASKFRTVLVVFLVGFALGLSVFVASRLFVRAFLNGDAIAAAESVAVQLARGRTPQPGSGLSSVLRYTYFDRQGDIVASAEPTGSQAQPLAKGIDIERLSTTTLRGVPVIEDEPLVASLLGLAEAAVKKVAVPVIGTDGRPLGTLIAEVDQRRSLEALTRAFSVVGIVTVGLAVLAVIAVIFVVTRGRGLNQKQKVFDPSALPRDALTDVPTRSGLTAALEDAVERAAATDQQVGLMIVGLDGFRAVNDIWGHAVGDMVLQKTVERLRSFAKGPAKVARVAGDEFAVIIEGDATAAMHKVADNIRAAIAEPFEVEGSLVLLGASVGAALYPINAENGQFLFRAADSALSKAKAQGRNALAFFDTEMKERMQRNAALERDMRLALSRNEFVVFYQPQIELATGRLRGYEALARWERPGEGMVAARDFLAVAEETGLIREIGEWVLRQACADAASWLDTGTVAVNLSAGQFRTPGIDRKIAQVIADAGLPPERLEIEVPEQLFLNHTPEVMDTLARIKALGVRVAMDGFGGGYTGLAALTRFPFDKVKIDRAFVGQLTEDAGMAPIVSAVLALGRTLSVDVTAEGVETKEQVTLLKAAGCKIAQGFLFGAPRRDAGADAGASAEAAAKTASG